MGLIVKKAALLLVKKASSFLVKDFPITSCGPLPEAGTGSPHHCP
tara:strand:- start:2 stop:136 length:135 start_codon:yes stop_codon:yes gene_type:complete